MKNLTIKFISLGLASILTVFSIVTPISAATQKNINNTNISKISNENIENEMESRIGVGEVIALFGLSVKGTYEFGVYARNHRLNYRVCQATIINACGIQGVASGLVTVYLVAFDNGWRSK